MNFEQEQFRVGVIRPIELFKETWQLIKDEYWLIFAITLLGMVVASLIPIVLIGPMMCGIYMALLAKIDGGKADLQLLFRGFDRFLPSLLLTIIIVGPFFVMLLGIYIPMVVMALAGERMSQEELLVFLGILIAVELVLGIIMVGLHSLLIFAYPLIAERKMSAMQAMRLSSRASWQNLGGITGLIAVAFGLSILGYLMLCVGIYLVLPLIMAATAVAYRKVFPLETQQLAESAASFGR
ncbi:MAG: hypothetical protein IPM50_00295 [Acidobacteriota bacterium]|nr:MAG: hypothetical protein IPM50_00295 [Acidobacteriota bacterium]